MSDRGRSPGPNGGAQGRSASGDPTARVARLDVPAHPASLGGLRHEAVAFARAAGGETETAERLELVISELATNVIRHTDAPRIRVVVRRRPSDWVLEVADADGLDLSVDVAEPTVDASAGRGLFVVRALMDTVTTTDVDGERVVRCTLAAP